MRSVQTWKLFGVVLAVGALATVGCGGSDEVAPGSGAPADAGSDGDVDAGDAEAAECGNGIVEGAEECDDSNDVDDDECHNDCTAACGDGVLQDFEECDTAIAAGEAGACPTSCDDAQTCETGSLQGNACTQVCVYEPVAVCADGDGCCGFGCDASNDNDCSAECGNGTLEPGETCDPPGSCPTVCDDSDPCTNDSMTGSASTCDAECVYEAITTCSDSDGCCLSTCNSTTDNDCSASCGDGVVDPNANETCDPPSSCPTSCDDGQACTTDTLIGSAANCNAECTHTDITTAQANDGCCPPGANANVDSDCAASCGNDIVEPGETCDGNCPASCDDSNACTTDTSTGSAGTCDLDCTNTQITACVDDDGCCPSSCNGTDDNDCQAVCGNGVTEGAETCDGDCPTSCDDSNACTTDTLSGTPTSCNVVCTNTDITTPINGDGCCPSGANANDDDDCTPSCGNSVVESGETCDGNCPTTCDDANACTTDSSTGSAGTCDFACVNTAVTACANGDGCCPSGCNSTNDDDCSASCGNGVQESGETCDPPSSCPTTCDDSDACTTDTMSGSAANCNVSCTNTPITSPVNGDGCCPSGANANNDDDCTPTCGNGIVESGETCDGNCASTCDDTNACTTDSSSGSSGTCDLVCSNDPITACVDGDGCCPSSCNANNDNDCTPFCGNGVVEGSEVCDGNCPTTCDDSVPCTVDTMNGSASNCNVTCTHTAITTCKATADGCCLSSCNSLNDADCAPECGNGAVESGETCDGNCPTTCDDSVDCTADTSTGSAGTCDLVCANTPITACADNDGCCAAGCTALVDNDCPVTVDPTSNVTPTQACLTSSTNAKTAIVVTLVDTLGADMTGVTVTMSTTLGTLSAVQSSGNEYWAILSPPGAATGTATITIVADGVTLDTQPQVQMATPFTDLDGGAGGCTVQGNLRVRVVDPGGSPIQDAYVMVGMAQNTAAYVPSYGGTASAANTARTNANGYAEFLDYGTTLQGPMTVTAGQTGYYYMTFVDIDAADIVLPLDLVDPNISTGTFTGDITPINAPTGDPVEMGVQLPDVMLEDLSTLSLDSLIGRNECYSAGGFAGDLSIPSNIYIPDQQAVLFLQHLPEHEYTSGPMEYGARKLIGISGAAPLSAVTGGGIAGALTSLNLNQIGVVDRNVSAPGPTRQDIGLTQTLSKDVNCTISGSPSGTDVLCATAVDFDSAGNGSLSPGEGRIGLTGFKAGAEGSITGVGRAPKSGSFTGLDYLGAAAALYLDAATAPSPAVERGVSAILKRTNPYGTSGGTMTFNDFFPIRTLTLTGRQIDLSAVTGADYVLHIIARDVSTPYVACDPANPESSTESFTLWRLYSPGDLNTVTLPTLPTGWPRASTGTFSGLVDPAATAEDDVINWMTMTQAEKLRAGSNPFVWDTLSLADIRRYLTHVSANSIDFP